METGNTNEAGEASLARRRVRAAKLCAASFYAALTGLPVWLFVARPSGVLTGLVAIVLATWGLIELGRTGMGRLRRRRGASLERVSSRMAHRTRRQAWIGLPLGIALLLMGALDIAGWVVRARRYEEAARRDAERRLALRFEREAEAARWERTRARRGWEVQLRRPREPALRTAGTARLAVSWYEGAATETVEVRFDETQEAQGVLATLASAMQSRGWQVTHEEDARGGPALRVLADAAGHPPKSLRMERVETEGQEGREWDRWNLHPTP